MAAVVILLGGGGGALAWRLSSRGGDPGPVTASTSTPTLAAPSSPPVTSTPSATPSGDFLTRLKQRETDPRPLTLDEIFREKRVSADGRDYTRAARKEDKNCTTAVRGSSLRGALRQGKCTQLLRASYVSQNGDVVGTIGIANLANERAAKRAYDSAQERTTHVVPLPGSGPADNLSTSSAALGGPSVTGHYLVLQWVQYADGRNPSSTGDKKLNRFAEDVFENTILTALSFRRLTGQPLNP